MGVNGVTNTPATANNKVKEFNNSLDKDAFLNLLVTQLRYQNPLQPMDDKEFIAQMAQFSSLEQAQNTNKIAKINSAYGMVGKLVSATAKDDTGEMEEIVGIVDKVKISGNEAYLVIKDKEIPYEYVNEVTDAISNLEQSQMFLQNFRYNMAYSLLGKDVKAKQNKVEVEGKVEGLRSVNGSVKLIVGEYELSLEEVYEIR